MKLYFARNKNGKFLSGVDNRYKYEYCWSDKLEDARNYDKPGPMKSMITKCYNKWPQYGCPELLEFTIEEKDAVVINYKEISETRTKQREHQAAKQKIIQYQRDREYLEKQIADLNQKLQTINGN